MRPARQCRSLNHIQSEGVVLDVCWGGLRYVEQYGFKKKPYRLWHHGFDTRKLTYIHQKTKTFLLSVTVTQVTLLTQTSHSGLTIQTCWPTLTVVHKFTGSPSGLQQTEASHINKTLPHIAFSCSSILKLYSCWWKRQIGIITSTWIHRTEDGPYCSALQFKICVCFWQLFADGERSKGHVEQLLVSTRTVLLSLLWKHYETRQILSCT